MKKYLITATFLLCGLSIYAQSFTEIKGTVDSENIKTVCLYKVVLGKLDTIATAIPMSDGAFGFLFKPTDSGFYTVGTRNWSHRLYLKPGDKASVTLNDTLLTLVGSNTKENETLYQWEQMSYKLKKMTVYFMSGGNHTYKEMFPELTSINEQSKSFIKSINTGNAEFDRLMANTVPFDIDYCALLSIFTPRTIHPKKEEYPAAITNITKSRLYDNDELLKQPYGRNLISLVCMKKSNDYNIPNYDFDAYLNCVGGTISKGELVISKANQLHSYKEFSDLATKYAAFITTADQKERMENMRLKRLVYKVGTPAYDFTYPDASGKMTSLSDFKGKVVLVDVWATWCSPCKKEIPSMHALEEEYKGKNIVFMSVSVDEKKNYEKWKSYIKEKQMGGIQLFAEGWSKITKDYKITGIPRFMLFDKEGNIVTVDAPRPSDPALSKLINEQLQK